MAFQDRLNMNKRATVPQTPYTTERYEKEIALSSKASAEATDVNIKHRVEKVQSGNTSGESRFFDKVVEENTPHPPYLKFTALESSTVKFVQQGTWSGVWTIETSPNGRQWSSYSLGTDISLSTGQSVYFRGQKDSTHQGSDRYHKFVMTGSISASGDCTSLLNGIGGVLDLTPYGEATFIRMFSGCPISSAPVLPSTIIGDSCYEGMFFECTLLGYAPALPAETISGSCYSSMFNGCTSLITPPQILPATSLVNNCYSWMFNGCTSLTSAPALPAASSNSNCYKYMFNGCSALTGPVLISASSPFVGGYPACTQMFTDSGTSEGAGGVIKVGGNASLWNQENCGITTPPWIVELIQ